MFQMATSRLKNTQKDLLLSILSKNRTSWIGQKFEFNNINSITDFQQRLPLTVYEDYIKAIQRIDQGEDDVLTVDSVPFLQPSSGTAAPSKYLPFTLSLRTQYQRGIKPWLANLIISRTSSYNQQELRLAGEIANQL
jgi:hypothetical protein